MKKTGSRGPGPALSTYTRPDLVRLPSRETADSSVSVGRAGG